MTETALPNLSRRRIALGVTGSIACYKAAELASRLTQAGALVDVILTDSALRFITPVTFQSLTGRKVYTDADLWGGQAHVLHVELGREASLVVIAPATANTLAKLAHGQADNLLTITALSTPAPLLLAPAMDGGMYAHPATQANLTVLGERGAFIVGPVEGRMASGMTGLGRMIEPPDLVGAVRLVLGRTGPLAGRHVVVTAGGTQEPLDPVRAIVNRSSGKQGYALAQAAIDRGAKVTLISGPTALAAPFGVERIDVSTAEEMRQAVVQAVAAADVLLMAAAVADFRPVTSAGHKIKRAQSSLDLHLEATADILGEVHRLRGGPGGRPAVVVGFAAESQELLANARAKLEAKGVAMIVANDVTQPGAGFAVDTNRVTLLDAGGGVQELPLMSKAEVAGHVLDRVQALLGASG